jgi:uncharacterized membrane protein YdjX (TVP38/TMEM64 family)
MISPNKIIKRIKRNKRIVILSVLFIVFYIALYFVFRERGISKEEIRKLIEPFGGYGLLALFVLQIVFSLTPMPDGTMPLLAMLMYGPIGVFVIMIAMFIGAIIHYAIAHHFGKAFIINKFPEVEKYLNRIGSRDVIIRLVALRMFTFVSFDITSYIAGISGIPFKKFLIGTLIGLLPTNFILILIGYGLFAKTQVEIITTWGTIAILIIFLFVFYKKSMSK